MDRTRATGTRPPPDDAAAGRSWCVAVVVLVAVLAGIGLVVFRDDAEATVGRLLGRGRPADRRRPGPRRRRCEDVRRRLRHLGRRTGPACRARPRRSPRPRRRSSSEQVGRALDGDTANAPTTWVPDSSLWRSVLARDPRLSSVLPRNYPVVAATPVVFAAPRPMAEALGWPDDAALVGAARARWPRTPPAGPP